MVQKCEVPGEDLQQLLPMAYKDQCSNYDTATEGLSHNPARNLTRPQRRGLEPLPTPSQIPEQGGLGNHRHGRRGRDEENAQENNQVTERQTAIETIHHTQGACTHRSSQGMERRVLPEL